jgi:hypothetical protein
MWDSRVLKQEPMMMMMTSSWLTLQAHKKAPRVRQKHDKLAHYFCDLFASQPCEGGSLFVGTRNSVFLAAQPMSIFQDRWMVPKICWFRVVAVQVACSIYEETTKHSQGTVLNSPQVSK